MVYRKVTLRIIKKIKSYGNKIFIEMPIDTVDSIKRRMIRNASKIWGYPDVQDISSFDPVLGLIIGSLAEEIHSISREINRADTRITEKLLDLLFNRNMFTHFPAHAVASAKPMQPTVRINELYQFYFSKEMVGTGDSGGAAEKKNVFFTPVSDCLLFNGEIKFLFTGKYLYEVDGRLKEIIAESHNKVRSDNSRLYVGIWLDPLIEILDGLSLFFSFKNIQSEERFYHALNKAGWKINGREVIFGTGMETDMTTVGNSLNDLLKKESDISYRTNHFINDFYRKRFMTLTRGNYLQKDLLGDNNEPHVLQEYFADEAPEVFNKEIFWLEIDLAQPFSFEDINELVISLNSFPVINRELNEYTHSIIKGTNVIPLFTDDLFFDVQRVSDSKDEIYMPRLSEGNSNDDKNTYMVRQGGIGRFDSRDAKEYLNNLIELVRDESAAFAIKGGDLISFELKQLDQIISRLEQRVGIDGIGNELNSYLIMESAADYDKINVQFWSIAGNFANNIRPGTSLSVYRGVDVEDGSVKLLSQTVGGRQKLSHEDKLNTLRRSLLSRGRIVTAEDIKALCFEIFSSDLKWAEVKKGISIVHSHGKGMSRTLDVYLSLNKDNSLSAEEIRHKTESLKLRLKEDSVNLLPYRVFIK
jgi:hypothetical protein